MHETISIFGLGKLGCTMLACFAEKQWKVIGVDINDKFVRDVNNGKSPIFEPGVDNLLKANKKRISATQDSKYAINNSSISFVIVPTPSLSDGSFSMKYVKSVIRELGKALRQKEEYHLVVITSTVLPGDSEELVILLETSSNKKCNKHFSVCYNPDFIALGNVVSDFLNPDMVLIGESDKKGGDILQNLHERLVDNNPTIHRMNFYNAELSKIALNSYCTLKITFANAIAEICENLPGGDADIVTNAIGDDQRIGRKYIKPGLAFGGPCFPRDNRAFSHAAAKFGVENTFAEKTDEINNYHKDIRIPHKIIEILKINKVNSLAILGLTYKNDTTLIEESAAISIIKTLSSFGIKLELYDPSGYDLAKIELSDIKNIDYHISPKKCVTGQRVCFIATPWKEIKERQIWRY